MKKYKLIFVCVLFILLCPQLSNAGQEPDVRSSPEKNRILTVQQVPGEHAQNGTRPAARNTNGNNKSASNGVNFEQRYPSKYRVKKGETLADIARRKEIFNDPYLWPLIYKANRDQIRDPHVIFPGQQLTIPRNITREDILEARKQAEAFPLSPPPRDTNGPDVYRGASPADNASEKKPDAGR